MSEALKTAAKHVEAFMVHVHVEDEDAVVRLSIRDVRRTGVPGQPKRRRTATSAPSSRGAVTSGEASDPDP